MIEKSHDENGNVHLSVPQEAMKYAKIGSFVVLCIVGSSFLPAIIGAFSSLIFGGIILAGAGFGYVLMKNKDFKRGLKYWIKTNTKKIVENVFKVSPIEVAQIILEEKQTEYKNIEFNIQTLQETLAKIRAKKNINDATIKEKENLLLIAENNKESLKTDIININAIELSELMESNRFLVDQGAKIEETIIGLSQVKEAAKYKLDRDIISFNQMKERSEIVTIAHNALRSANNILVGDNKNEELKKMIAEHCGEIEVKIAQIQSYGTTSQGFIEQVQLEKQASTMTALDKIRENKQLLEVNS